MSVEPVLEAWRKSRRHLVASVSIPLVLASSTGGRAQDRTFADLEPVTPRYTLVGQARTAVSTVGISVGWGNGTFIPYVGGGIAFFTLQARAGLMVLPNGLASAGPVFRVEARPQTFFNPCFEPALLGNIGLGYRWSLEPSYPDVRPGAGLFLMPAFDGGEAWIRPHCSNTGGPVTPREAKLLLGGTVVLGLDW